jgi:hypothetical protein
MTATIDQVWFDQIHVGAADESEEGETVEVPLVDAADTAKRMLVAGASVQVTWLGGSAQTEWMTSDAEVEAFAGEVAAWVRGEE